MHSFNEIIFLHVDRGGRIRKLQQHKARVNGERIREFFVSDDSKELYFHGTDNKKFENNHIPQS